MATRILNTTLEREMLRLWPDKKIPQGEQVALAKKYGINVKRINDIAKKRGFSGPRVTRSEEAND